MTETIIKNPPWWNRRSKLEKKLFIFLGLLLIISIILAVLLLLFLLQKPEPEVCLTPGCIESASQLLKKMNQNVDPCDNFYEFTCGNFAKNVEIPKTKTSVTSLAMIEDQVQDQLRKILEEPLSSLEPKSFELAKKYYSICMDLNKIEEEGLTPMKNVLSNLGGWPIIESNWTSENFDWKELNYKLRKTGFEIGHIVNLVIGVDTKDPKKRILNINQANLELPREILLTNLDNRIMRAYFRYMLDVAMIFGANNNSVIKDLLDVVEFQQSLANISLAQTELRNASLLYNPMTVNELQIRYPFIPWLDYLNNITAPIFKVYNDTIIINEVPSYLEKLEPILQSTPKRTIANYILWQVVKYSISALPDKVQKAQLRFLNSAAGITDTDPRWLKCVSITKKYFDLITASMYIRKYFDEESKRKAVEIVEDMRNSFSDILKEIKWMDEKTKKNALEKLKTMDAHVGYPNELLDDRKLNKYYEKLKIRDKSFLYFTLTTNKWAYDLAFEHLLKPVNKSDWTEHGSSASVEAYYIPTENSISLPAGIFQGSFFSSDRPNYMNYGAIGFTIGHEITHGFDDQGRQYNKDGSVVDWWAPSTEQAFLEKTDCIIQQYNQYVVPEINITIDGYLTLGENIADNGGIKEAYLAYKKWVDRNQKEEQLPGLPYTPLQMFWISMASTWCSIDRPEHLRILLHTDVHAPYPFRIIGSISNRPEFAEDFNCPVGSKMNPQLKCQVW